MAGAAAASFSPVEQEAMAEGTLTKTTLTMPTSSSQACYLPEDVFLAARPTVQRSKRRGHQRMWKGRRARTTAFGTQWGG